MGPPGKQSRPASLHGVSFGWRAEIHDLAQQSNDIRDDVDYLNLIAPGADIARGSSLSRTPKSNALRRVEPILRREADSVCLNRRTGLTREDRHLPAHAESDCNFCGASVFR
jgi:hypothetical protein